MRRCDLRVPLVLCYARSHSLVLLENGLFGQNCTRSPLSDPSTSRENRATDTLRSNCMLFELVAIYRRYLKGSKTGLAAVCCAFLCAPAILLGFSRKLFGFGLPGEKVMVILGAMFMAGTFLGCGLMAIAMFRSARSTDSKGVAEQ
jgi:hypothetical protein